MSGCSDTAIHEAGHAVIGRVLGIPCGEASILADEDSSGHSITGDVWATLSAWESRGKFRDVRSSYLARIVTYMAGAEATTEILGLAMEEAGDEEDERQISLMLDDVGGYSEERVRAATRHLVRRHRGKIEEVASILEAASTLPASLLDEIVSGST